MSDPIFDGGPANPIGNEPGISVRDFFASAIISGMYASGAQSDKAAAAILAYQQADEMLQVRTQPILTSEPAPAPEPAPEPPAAP